MGLRLTEFEDIELMFKVVDSADPETGVATAQAIAENIGLDDKDPQRNVGARLAWLRRYGVVDKNSKGWYVNEIGEQLMRGELTAAQKQAFAQLSQPRTLAAARRLSQVLAEAGPEAAVMMHRQWRYGLAQRRR
jgi:hypothetical protein